MMRPGRQLLLPVNVWFIALSVLVALLLNILPLGRLAGMPDFLALVLMFWCVHQPLRVGIGMAFMLGLLMDVNHASLLGQHAMAYATLGFLASLVHRRLLWFTVPSQALQVLPLFAAAHGLELAIRFLITGALPGWSVLLAPLAEAALWPLASILLLMPQRRPPDPDQNRPL